jgi:hypothetical protein
VHRVVNSGALDSDDETCRLRSCSRLGQMRNPSDEACERAEVAPIVAVRAFRRLRATGLSGRASSFRSSATSASMWPGASNRTGAARECGSYRRSHKAVQWQNGHCRCERAFEGRDFRIWACPLACEKTLLSHVSRSARKLAAHALLAPEGGSSVRRSQSRLRAKSFAPTHATNAAATSPRHDTN